MSRWLIFCEEAGDKAFPWKRGSTNYYVISAVLVREKHEEQFLRAIKDSTYRVLRMRRPLEWKKISSQYKRDDKRLARFIRRINKEGPNYLVSTVICNKHESNGPGLASPIIFMNYLYGLMFKRLSPFLRATRSSARLIIDRNTDNLAQQSLHAYISDISRAYTGEPPRHSKPKWLNPEDHAILGYADFISGISLRAMSDYWDKSHNICSPCTTKTTDCIYICTTSNFGYPRSYQLIVDSNYESSLHKWNWKGLCTIHASIRIIIPNYSSQGKDKKAAQWAAKFARREDPTSKLDAAV